MRRNERQIYSYDFRIKRQKQLAPFPPMEDFAAAWQAQFNAGDTSYERERGDIQFRIGDFAIDHSNRCLKMLILRGDIHASNPYFRDRATGQGRAVTRTATEDGERAAHLVISLDQEAGQQGVYLGHLEGVQGISHRQVQGLLNAVLKRAIASNSATFEFPDTGGAKARDGSAKMHSYVPTLELEGHLADSVVQSIEQGVVSTITLIDRRANARLGGSQFLVEKEKYLVVRADPNIPRQGRLDAIIAAARSQLATSRLSD